MHWATRSLTHAFVTLLIQLLVCVDGSYGEDCLLQCGNCVNNTVCDVTVGSCDEGCVDGYVEPLCAEGRAQTTMSIVLMTYKCAHVHTYTCNECPYN